MNVDFSNDFGLTLKKLVVFFRDTRSCATCTRLFRLINMPNGTLRAPPPPTAVSLIHRLRRMSILAFPRTDTYKHRGDRSTLMLIVLTKVGWTGPEQQWGRIHRGLPTRLPQIPGWWGWEHRRGAVVNIEYTSGWPFVGIGFPPPLASGECVSHLDPKGGGATLPCGWWGGAGGPNSDWKESLALCILYGEHSEVEFIEDCRLFARCPLIFID